MKYEIQGFTHAAKGDRSVSIEHYWPLVTSQSFRRVMSHVRIDDSGVLHTSFPDEIEQKYKNVIGFRLDRENGEWYMVADFLNPSRFRRTIKVGLVNGAGVTLEQVCDEIDFLNAAFEGVFAERKHAEEQEKQILMFA